MLLYKPFETAKARKSTDWSHAVIRDPYTGSSELVGFAVKHLDTFLGALFEQQSNMAHHDEYPSWTVMERVYERSPLIVDVALRFDGNISEETESTLCDAIGDRSSDTLGMLVINLVNGIERTLATETANMPADLHDPAWTCMVLVSDLGRVGEDEGGKIVMRIRVQYPMFRMQRSEFPLFEERLHTVLRSSNLWATLPSAPLDTIDSAVVCPKDAVSMANWPSVHPLVKWGPILKPFACFAGPDNDLLTHNEGWTDRHATIDFELDPKSIWKPREHAELTGNAPDCIWTVLTQSFSPNKPVLLKDFNRPSSRTTARAPSASSRSSIRSVSRSGDAYKLSLPAKKREGKPEIDIAYARMELKTKTRKSATPKPKKSEGFVEPLTSNIDHFRPTSSASAASSRSSSRSSDISSGFNIAEQTGEQPFHSYAHTVSTSNSLREIPGTRVRMERPDFINLPDDFVNMRFMDMIDSGRANKDEDFADILKAVHNLTLGHKVGLSTMVSFSRRGRSKHTPEQIEEMWKSADIEKHGKTCRTLAFFAREDSPTSYTQWHDEWLEEAFYNAMNGTHHDVAVPFYRLNWLEVMCTGNDKPEWYRFAEHAWVPTTGLEMQQQYMLFLDACLDRHAKKLDWYTEATEKKNEGAADEKDIIKTDTWIKAFNSVLEKMKSTSFMMNVIRIAASMFLRTDYKDVVNANPGLKACRNGIVVCGAQGAYVRPGRPEDFCTMRLGFKHREEYGQYLAEHGSFHPHVLSILEFYHKLWCDDELEEYQRRDLASYLYSANLEKLLRNWIGELANNGKSTLVNFLMSILGDFAVPLTISMYTGNEGNAEGSMPQLKSTRFRSVAFISETRENQQMNGNRLKEHTGNDVVAYRGHYEEMQRMRLTFKLIIQSNYYAQLNTGGNGMMNRAVFCPFNSVFTDDAPESEEEQFRTRRFKNDKNFNTKLEELKDAAGWLMIHDYAAYKAKGLEVKPAVIIKTTQNYWEKENVFGAFVTNTLERVTICDPETGEKKPDASIKLTWKELNACFGKWFDDNMKASLGKRPERQQSIQYFTRLLGTPIKEGKTEVWNGWRISM